MLTAAVFVGLLAFVSAHGGNMMGSNMGYGMQGNNGYMGNNGMGQLMGLLSGQSMGGQMGGYMGGQMGGNMGGYMGGNMMGQMGGRGQMGGQQGMMGGVMLLLLQNMLQNRGGRGGDRDDDDMEEAQEMLRQKMMMETAEMVMMQAEYKEKQEAFAQAMEAMCFMMAAEYEYYKRNGTEIFQKTNDATMESLEKQTEDMNEREKLDFAVNMLNKEPRKYSEIALRFITYACKSGEAYAEAYSKMDKMQDDDGHCGDD